MINKQDRMKIDLTGLGYQDTWRAAKIVDRNHRCPSVNGRLGLVISPIVLIVTPTRYYENGRA